MLGETMLGYEVRVKNGLWRMKERTKEAVHDFFITEDGDTNFISIVIILVVVVALALVFRENIKAIVNAAWNSIFKDAKGAINSNELGDTPASLFDGGGTGGTTGGTGAGATSGVGSGK